MSIDIGMQYPAGSGKGKQGNGFFTDTAITVAAGTIPETVKQLLAVTQQSLYKGIAACGSGTTIADIGKAVQTYVDPHGYGIVRDLVGHGVGHEVHEEPAVPNYYDSHLESWQLRPGMVIAIEPMLTMGGAETALLDDDWTIVTDDGSLSAHFEHTVVLTEDGPVIATKRPSEQC